MTARDGAPEGLLSAGGECCRCGERVGERITVALSGGNSGPGWSHEACLPCARRIARSVFAPYWLREDLAELDAARAPVLRAVPPAPQREDR